VQIVAVGASDVGQHRQGNEDSFLVDEALGLFVVCDGMGGHAAGEVASGLAVESICERVQARLPSVTALEPDHRPAAMAELMRDAVERANAKVHALGKDPKKHGAGTTCTALLIHGDNAAMAHVGDSRLYLQRQGQVNQISNDHTFIAEAMRRGLSYEDALAQFGRNMLSRAVGPAEHVDIDTLAFDVLPGDRLVLCSDGLHGYFDDPREIGAHLSPPTTAPKRLVALANERGGEDNITVVVVEAVADAHATAQESMRLSRVTQNLQALKGIELLRELTYSEVLEIASAARHEEVGPGHVVLREGDPSSALYIIATGKVEVERGGKKLADLGPGSHFGEMALLTNRPRSATVKSVEPCRLLVLGREQMYPLFQTNPIIAVKFLWNLAVRQSLRLDEATEWLSHAGEVAPDTLIDSPPHDLCASPYSLGRR
jgi:serine/threonine protein phosphatase PrpC